MSASRYEEMKKAATVLIRGGWWVEIIEQGNTTRIQLRSYAAKGVHRTAEDVLLALRNEYEPKVP